MKYNSKSKGKKVFLNYNACQRRSMDTKKMSLYFKANNYKIVNDPKEADYIVFFTCSFVDDLAVQCLDRIKKFKKYDAELIVAGCLPDIVPERLREVFNGKIIPTANLEVVDELFPEHKIKFSEINEPHCLWRNYNPYGISVQPVKAIKTLINKSKIVGNSYRFIKENVLRKYFSERIPFKPLFLANEDAYLLFISRGCVHNCSYCAIKKAVGPLKSKPIEQCVKEFKEGLDKGHKYFDLNADDVGVYGLDLKTNFAELLDQLTKFEGDYQIKMENTHPRWIIKYIDKLEEIFVRKKIRSMIISVQSGSPKILKLMRRTMDPDALVDAVARLKKVHPDLQIFSHFIVGFPSETEENFQETLDVIKRIKFDHALVFEYSDVDDTESTKIKPKVPKSVIHKRKKIALKLIDQIQKKRVN